MRWLGLLAGFAGICLVGLLAWSVFAKPKRASLPYVIGEGLEDWTDVCIGGASSVTFDGADPLVCSMPFGEASETRVTALTYRMTDRSCTTHVLEGPFLEDGAYETRCYSATEVARDILVLTDGAVRFEGY